MAQVLQPLSAQFKTADYPNLLVGLGALDDAAVYRIDDERVLIQTIDFFPPVVDDPFTYGAITAANAMSDVYAMGGEVVLGLNIAAWRDDLPLELLSEILRGGGEKMREAGGVIAGGHTIKNDEPKYGIAVTGMARPEEIFTKAGARPGDVLVLTKPLGTGILTTAGKNGKVQQDQLERAIRWMLQLNRGAMHAARATGLRCATDITGYSLLGHSYEMAAASDVAFEIETKNVPILDGALELAARQQIPGGTSRNRDYLDDKVFLPKGLPSEWDAVLFDPQTSGGLLLPVAEDRLPALLRELEARSVGHWEIGRVVDGSGIQVI